MHTDVHMHTQKRKYRYRLTETTTTKVYTAMMQFSHINQYVGTRTGHNLYSKSPVPVWTNTDVNAQH